MLVLEYLEPSSGKLYHHKIRLGKIKENDQPKDVYERIEKKHHKYLGNI